MSKKNNQITIRSSAAEYLTFLASTSVDNQKIEIRYEDENLWLTQKLISNLYDVEVNTINYHIKKIFTDNELEENSVIRNFRITANDGKTYHHAKDIVLNLHKPHPDNLLKTYLVKQIQEKLKEAFNG